MEEIQETKNSIRKDVEDHLETMAPETVASKTEKIIERLFDFANYLESKIVLLYTDRPGAVSTAEIIERSYGYGKIVVLPAFDVKKTTIKLMKVDQPGKELISGGRKFLEPHPARCKIVPIDCIDIAVIPGIVFDEKGGRIGSGLGYYDRLIPELPITARKVALAFEEQIAPLVPMEAHDKYVDIIITEKRTIYKI